MSIYLVNNIIIPLDAQPDFRREVMNALRCKGRDLLSVDIYRKSVDARKKDHILLNYTVAATLKDGVVLSPRAAGRLLREEKPSFTPGTEKLRHRPVIIGTGPAGMFAGLTLARAGYRPILLEQGAPMEQRMLDVDNFMEEHRLEERNNVKNGEDRASTF